MYLSRDRIQSRPRRRARDCKPPIKASGADNRNMLTAAAPGGISLSGELQAPPNSAAEIGSCAAIGVAAGAGVLVGPAEVGIDGETRVGVGAGGSVAVGMSEGIGAGVFIGGGGGVASPLMVSMKSPVCAPL